jgi:hypothetical protein
MFQTAHKPTRRAAAVAASPAPGPRSHSRCRGLDGHRVRCRRRRYSGGRERVACRAHVEGLLEHVVEPGELFHRDRIGLCNLCVALFPKCVRREEREKGGR